MITNIEQLHVITHNPEEHKLVVDYVFPNIVDALGYRTSMETNHSKEYQVMSLAEHLDAVREKAYEAGQHNVEEAMNGI